MVSYKKETSKQARTTNKLCRVEFVTQIFPTSVKLMFSPTMINILQYVHHNPCRFKNVRLPEVYSQPLSINGMLVLRENRAYLKT